jgi:hypothetical protein
MLLDALSVCGCALAQLGAALTPKAVLDAGLLPEEVSLEAPFAPYKLRLRIVRVSHVCRRGGFSHGSLPC